MYFNNPHLYKLIQKIHQSHSFDINDLDDAVVFHNKLEKYRMKYEHNMYRDMLLLSPDQQVILLEHCLDQFVKHRLLYILPKRPYEGKPSYEQEELWRSRHDPEIINFNFELKELSDEEKLRYDILNMRMTIDENTASSMEYGLYDDYEYLDWLISERIEVGPNELVSDLTDTQKKRIREKIISNTYEKAHESTLNQYQKITDKELRGLWILDYNKWRYKKQEDEEKNEFSIMCRDAIRNLNFFKGNNKNNIKEEISLNSESSSIKGPLLKWQFERGGVADMAELLYRLEKGGFINLKEFMNDGNVSELCRRICYIFNFSGKDPISNLKAYLSDLKVKDSLGEGPVKLEDLKPIGRSRGGKMDSVLPAQD
ncbi:hypothetical protein MUN82_12270 [Hymenobacter aerilatus]|uniref:Uncharacterized protein n=1 Tax=Hymenobacter aerilatus TaxID=2932251 RepID=A0A8T9SSK1_9BACT|nr:hypothetical protein [Hymenobacter aerilatus]UOR03723.1 hypothetical protein MUN82_12270 [Hymenobacter aerilatus]